MAYEGEVPLAAAVGDDTLLRLADRLTEDRSAPTAERADVLGFVHARTDAAEGSQLVRWSARLLISRNQTALPYTFFDATW